LTLSWIGAMRVIELFAVGIGWLVFTLSFDLLMGAIQGERIRQQFDAYLFKRGNLWPVVLLVTAGAPWVAAKLRGWV
jgi:hypothetical protein